MVLRRDYFLYPPDNSPCCKRPATSRSHLSWRWVARPRDSCVWPGPDVRSVAMRGTTCPWRSAWRREVVPERSWSSPRRKSSPWTVRPDHVTWTVMTSFNFRFGVWIMMPAKCRCLIFNLNNSYLATWIGWRFGLYYNVMGSCVEVHPDIQVYIRQFALVLTTYLKRKQTLYLIVYDSLHNSTLVFPNRLPTVQSGVSWQFIPLGGLVFFAT